MARSRGRRPVTPGRARSSGASPATEPPPPAISEAPRRPSRRRKAAFAAFAVAGFLLATELLLWAVGLNPDRKGFDPYAGFTSCTPHFRVETDGEGRETVVVAPSKREVLNDPGFPRRKRAGTYRIVCLGGSTTYGRPFFDATSYPGRLRAMLPEVDPSRRWEVINAGAISYASYRVRGLLTELSAYEPDLFVIDVGHNEFLERRTYADVFGTPRPIREAAGLVGRTRVGTAVERLLHASGLLGSTTFARSTGLAEEVRRVPVDPAGPGADDGDEAFRREVAGHFEASLDAMIDAAGEVGARVLLVAPASNLRDFAPFKSRHSRGLSPDRLREWDATYEDGLALQMAGDHAGAAASLESACRIDGGFAAAWFSLGTSQLALGRAEEARRCFDRAREEDVYAFRATEEIRRIIRRTAARRDVPLVDVEAEADRLAPHGIPGEGLFCDHVHFQPAGAQAAARALLEGLRRAGIVAGPSEGEPAALARAEARIRSAVDGPRDARELYGLSGLLAALGQREQALRRVREGLALSGGDAEGFRLAGRYASEMGRLDEAVDAYRRAVEFEPRSVEALEGLGGALLDRDDAAAALGPLAEAARLAPGSASVLNRLGVAHALAGQGADAVAILREASRLAPMEHAIRRNLGMAEERRGNLDQALSHYREALRLRPGDPESLEALARLKGRPE